MSRRTDWYGEPWLVPTWSYVAVHPRGEPKVLVETALRPVLDRSSAEFETRLAPKPPWRTSRIDDGRLAGMMRAIVPSEMSVEAVDSTFELSRNRSETAHAGAAAALARGGTPGREIPALAALMREIGTETAADRPTGTWMAGEMQRMESRPEGWRGDTGPAAQAAPCGANRAAAVAVIEAS